MNEKSIPIDADVIFSWPVSLTFGNVNVQPFLVGTCCDSPYMLSKHIFYSMAMEDTGILAITTRGILKQPAWWKKIKPGMFNIHNYYRGFMFPYTSLPCFLIFYKVLFQLLRHHSGIMKHILIDEIHQTMEWFTERSYTFRLSKAECSCEFTFPQLQSQRWA